jgi:hypothetical protein
MSRPKKQPHLQRKRTASGALVWVIRDGEDRISTGCGVGGDDAKATVEGVRDRRELSEQSRCATSPARLCFVMFSYRLTVKMLGGLIGATFGAGGV